MYILPLLPCAFNSGSQQSNPSPVPHYKPKIIFIFVSTTLVSIYNGHNSNGHKIDPMELLLEIREKTGLSQYELADYLDVSRSLVNMVEMGLRELPTPALLKAENMHKLIAAGEYKISSQVITDDEAIQKVKAYHKRKVEDHLFRVKSLNRRLAKMQKMHEQANAKLKLVSGLAKKNNLQTKRNKDDTHWLEYHDNRSRRKILKKAPAVDMLKIEIEVHLGYASVHEKILSKFF